jgi:Protein of unknown function (DUF1579)
MTNSPEQSFSPALRGLYEFAGNWNVHQRLWLEPDGDPVESDGRTQCRILLDGLAVLMITEITEGANQMKGLALMTQDEARTGLQMAWIDTFAGAGITLMSGLAARAPSRDSLRELFPNATAEREWQTNLGTAADVQAVAPDVNACFPIEALEATRGDVALAERTATIGLRVVENKVSDDQWVLEFFAPHPNGGEFLVQENTFQRV